MKIANENLKLESIRWKEFKLEQVFTEIKRGKRLIEKDRKKGNIPYYSASKENNGLTDLIANPLFIEKDKIIITTFCDCYYVEGVFTASDEITIFGNNELNKYSGLFVANIIKNNASKFAFGYKAFTERLKRQIIQLPQDENNFPNWHFMESYMKAIEKEHLEKITTYYNAKLAEADSWGGGFDLDEYKDFIKQGKSKSIQWKEFYFADIFKEIKRGKRLIKDDQIQGKTPYVSSSAFNNGVDNFIDNYENVRKFSDCISLANSGSVGSAFFHSYEFIASDHVTQLIQPKFSKYIYLFLLPIIARLSEKYSFNREINDKRIKREKLLLPMDTKGNPNWQFMENYTRNIEYKKISNAVDYYQKKIK
ncbi:TPA: restriction endonuclease subunit S [Campylobacter coli]|nr:restriction endonuclease subunit S [Campylobacter coli]EKT7741638.1 restriction endonuclease subunit S [Campylobacter coli]EKT7747389.1 restriction endonuclease subunit S [Campylobacter coli]HED7915788.1 restriction endonuclease subunit S [Campylobacter coli]HED7943832.1 restriction endonuclease subunit S [Campylobacter coli]